MKFDKHALSKCISFTISTNNRLSFIFFGIWSLECIYYLTLINQEVIKFAR